MKIKMILGMDAFAVSACYCRIHAALIPQIITVKWVNVGIRWTDKRLTMSSLGGVSATIQCSVRLADGRESVFVAASLIVYAELTRTSRLHLLSQTESTDRQHANSLFLLFSLPSLRDSPSLKEHLSP